MHHPSNPNSSLACMLNDSKSDQIIYIVNRNLITHTHTHKHTYIHTTWKKLEIDKSKPLPSYSKNINYCRLHKYMLPPFAS